LSAKKALEQILEEGRYGTSEPAPAGTLRGLDVLPLGVLRQKFSRATIIHAGARNALPNFLQPRTFFEKLVIAKFFAPIPMPSPADKLGLRPYCATNNPRFVGPFDPVWSGRQAITADLLRQLDLPAGSYYAKSNCGSGTNFKFSVPDPEDRLFQLESISSGWLRGGHGVRAGEWWYGLIAPRNFIEADMSSGEGSLTDWKFHTGGGRVFAVQVDRNRSTDHEQLVYDRAFSFLPEVLFFKTGQPETKPAFYEDMLAIAEDISKPFEYARVDLYEVNGRIYLGEITLAPMGGTRLPKSSRLDVFIGGQWQSPFFET
jgi:hypothetical protein